jgi:hypothetical protein
VASWPPAPWFQTVPYDLALGRTDAGRRLDLSRRVDVPAAVAWDVLTDVTHWPDWGPAVTGVDYPDRTLTDGTAGRVRLCQSLWVPFRINEVSAYRWTWTVWGRTPPAHGHRVDPIGDGACRVVFELPLWAPWYLPICVVALRSIARLATGD